MLRPAVLALVLSSPLALGGAPAWAWASLAVLLGALGCLQGGLLALAPAAPPAGGSPWPLPGWATAALALLAGLVVWQLAAPWPVHPLRPQLADALGGSAGAAQAVSLHRTVGQHGTVALHGAEAVDAAVRIASVVLLAWLAAQAWAGARTRPALAGLTAAGGLVAGTALLAHAAGIDGVLWLPGPFHPTPTGPFVARGAFACYLTLAMLAAAALWLTRRDGDPGWAAALAWALIAAGLIASQSRAGLAAAAAGHLLLLGLAVRGRWLAPRTAVLWGAGLLAAAGLAAVAAGAGGRLADLPADLAHRTVIWQAALAAIAERPWIGHGLGSFPHVFELYRPAAAAQPVVSAHSGPLEWAVELGVPGALAWLAVLAGAAVATLRARPAGAAALAGLPALAVVGVQGAVDPGPQVPAAALTAALLVGLALARPRV